MFRFLIQALPAYGPVLLFALICVESMGVPIPGETIVVAAAAFAAAGRLSIGWVVTATIAGGMVGGMLAYWVGRRGAARFRARSRLARLQRSRSARGAARGAEAAPRGAGERLERTRAFFARHGGKAVVGGRFIAFVRSFLGLAAGMAGMPFGDFVIWNTVGAAVWGGAFAALGYVFGRNLPRLERGLAAAGLMLAVFVALLALVTFLVKFAWPRRAEAWRPIERGWDRLAASPQARTLAQRLAGGWSAARAGLSPMAFLAMHVAGGMVLSLLALWIFGGLLEDMVGGGPLLRFDYALAQWAHEAATPFGISVARLISFLGSPLVLTLLGISVASRMLFRRQRIPALGWVASLLGAALLAVALERIVRRPAPSFPESFATGAEWSFPSPHALGGLVAYGMLAYLWATLRLDRAGARIAAVAAAGFLVLAIGASRLYLGVEYFSDVIGGFAAGAVWLGACVSGVELTWRTTTSARER